MHEMYQEKHGRNPLPPSSHTHEMEKDAQAPGRRLRLTHAGLDSRKRVWAMATTADHTSNNSSVEKKARREDPPAANMGKQNTIDATGASVYTVTVDRTTTNNSTITIKSKATIQQLLVAKGK
jgi:hypothetical protein